METCLSLSDEIGVKVVSEDTFPRQLEPALRESFLELFVEFVKLIVPGEGRRRGGGGGREWSAHYTLYIMHENESCCKQRRSGVLGASRGVWVYANKPQRLYTHCRSIVYKRTHLLNTK